MVNMFLDIGPLHTLENIEKVAKTEAYKDVSFSFIEEPNF